MESESPDLLALRRKLEVEETAYAAALDALDGLARFPLPVERRADFTDLMASLNALWAMPPAPAQGGIWSRARRAVWNLVAPHFEQQQRFNSVLVQALNAHLEETARQSAHLREVVAGLIRYLQCVLPTMDARDRLASALSTSRSELIVESYDRRRESLARRVEGLSGLCDRIEAIGEELRALRAALRSGPPPEVAARADQAASDSVYTAFENRFRGDADDVRERLASYLPLFAGLEPVVDLGCGRGEFLAMLREQGIAARGVESNLHAVQACQDQGFQVFHGDLMDFLRDQKDGSLGGIFAAQVVEHLPPAVLQDLLRAAHRVLRGRGLLLIETVNPRSVFGLLEVYYRDLTHQRPLHPDTLRFLAAAAGFTDVRIEYRSPLDASALLREVPVEELPPRVAQALNENVMRLNALLYGPQDYALIARR